MTTNGVMNGLAIPIAPQAAVPGPICGSVQPNFDALAVSLAAQNNAIAAQANYLTIATVFLGIVALVLAVGWGWIIKNWIKESAKDAVKEWMDKNAISELSAYVSQIVPNWMDDGSIVHGDNRRTVTQAEQEEGLEKDPTDKP